jgi:hypothetical protein
MIASEHFDAEIEGLAEELVGLVEPALVVQSCGESGQCLDTLRAGITGQPCQ